MGSYESEVQSGCKRLIYRQVGCHRPMSLNGLLKTV